MTDTTRVYAIGDQVIIKAHRSGAHWIPDQPGTIAAFDANGFCDSCHCCPPNPEHEGDRFSCCPGPWCVVAFTCPDCGDTHHEMYAEHELTMRCKKCGDMLDEHINPAAGCAIWACGSDGEVLTITEP